MQVPDPTRFSRKAFHAVLLECPEEFRLMDSSRTNRGTLQEGQKHVLREGYKKNEYIKEIIIK